MYTDKVAGEVLLAWYGHLALSNFADRQGGWRDVNQSSGFNLTSGAPNSEADLLPRWKAVGGVQLALEIVLVPRPFAKACLKRQTPTGTIALANVPEAQWTHQEVQAVEVMTLAIQRAVHRMTEAGGLFDPQPAALGLEEGHRLPLNHRTGLTEGFQIRWPGLKLAMEFAREHPELKWKGPEADFGELWRMVPEWQRQRWSNPNPVTL